MTPKEPKKAQPSRGPERFGAKPDERPAGAATGQRTKPGANRAAQRHLKESQAAQLTVPNVEESAHMDRGDSAAGSGQSMPEAKASERGAAESLRRGALDTQYGTRSSMKTEGADAPPGGADAERRNEQQPARSPGTSEDASGTERDTMTGPRPGSRS